MKIIANLIGITASCSGFAVMVFTFMMVYFDKWTVVPINQYGEANFEFVILLGLIPFVTYSTLCHIRTVVEDLKEE